MALDSLMHNGANETSIAIKSDVAKEPDDGII